MSAPLAVRNAQITTAAVEVKTLTITGKQVTLAVFRQLREEPLIADDGTLNGVPWGTVNYHPDKCASARKHLHIVWQDGEQLRRSLVFTEPGYGRDELYDDNPAFWEINGEASFAADILRWLDDGTPRYWSGGIFDLFTGKLVGGYGRHTIEPDDTYSQRQFVNDSLCDFTTLDKATGVRAGIKVRQEVRDAILASIDARKAHREYEEARERSEEHSTTWCSCAQCELPKLAKASEEAGTKLAVLEELYGKAPAEDLNAAYHDALAIEAARRKTYRDAETERRQRHQDVRTALAELPQLFIAV